MNVASRTPRRLVVPPLASGSVARRARQIARTLATVEHSVHLPWPEGGVLGVTRIAVAAATAPSPRHTAFRLGDGTPGATLVVETALARALVLRLLGAAPERVGAPATLPLSPVERGVLGAVIAGIGHRLGSQLGLYLEPAAQTAGARDAGEAGPRSETVAVLLEVKLTDAAGAIELAGRAAVLWTPDALCPGEAPPCPAGRLRKVPFPVGLEWARTRLCASALGGLGRGDVVVFSGTEGHLPGDSGARALWLRVGGARAPARCELESGQVRLLDDFVADVVGRKSGGTTMHDENTRDHQLDDAATGLSLAARDALAHAPVEVVAEAGRLTLTGAELAGLCQGMVLALGQPAAQPVVLTVAGRPIARGTLVEIEGELGVRVEETLL